MSNVEINKELFKWIGGLIYYPLDKDDENETVNGKRITVTSAFFLFPGVCGGAKKMGNRLLKLIFF